MAARKSKARSKRKPTPRKARIGRPPKHTEAEVEAALRAAGGVVLRTAQALKLDRRTVQRRIAASPRLQEVQEEMIEEDLDYAVHHVRRGTRIGRSWAVRETLRLHGHRRGLVSHSRLEFPPEGVPVQFPDLSGVPTALLREVLEHVK